MTWGGLHLLRRVLSLFGRFSRDDGAPKPAPKPHKKKPSTKPKRPSGTRYAWAIFLLLMPLLTGCGSFATKPPQPEPNRKCFQWLITAEQEVYVYENGSLISRIDTEPYDAVVSGWCLLKFGQDLANESRRLSQ
jgi:hypothetical protein